MLLFIKIKFLITINLMQRFINIKKTHLLYTLINYFYFLLFNKEHEIY